VKTLRVSANHSRRKFEDFSPATESFASYDNVEALFDYITELWIGMLEAVLAYRFVGVCMYNVLCRSKL
jgi:hypothetical protein